jgi:hypothetical protein
VRCLLATLAAALAALALIGCASGHGSGSGRIVVSATGRIGPLRVDESDRAAVISFAGGPESERHGRYVDFPPFDALGYGCRGKKATDEAGIPRCKTVFYFDSRSGELELLYTEDNRYVDTHGVYAGTRTLAAERQLHRRAFEGCFSGFRFETRTGLLVMWLEGSKTLKRDHVGFLVVHSKRLNPGVLDCIDS